MRTVPWILAVSLLSPVACRDRRGEQGQPPEGEPVPVEPGAFTHRLDESPADLPLWTTPTARKLQPVDRAPQESRSGLELSAARNEVEPVQLVLGPASGRVTISVAPFADLGVAHQIDLHRVGFSEGWSETLTPLGDGATLELSASEPTAVWLTVHVPEGAAAGEHQTTLTIGGDFGPVEVPVRLRVFDFSLPALSPFATQLNVDVSSLIPEGGEVDDAKTMLFEHRLTPKSLTWPSGFGWGITWENGDAPCEQLWDEPDEPEAYSIGALSRRYILGEGWNGVGFPTAMLFQFVDNGTPRPDTFCGIDRGDHFGTDAYNAEWQQWLGALDAYLVSAGLAERSYYYVQNEPQDDQDHALAAHLCRLTKAAAPDLKIAISEEPKPQIAEDPGGACGYDIWIAHVRAYEEGYAWERQRDHGEAVWFYSLDQDPDPYFNPTRIDTQGMHARIIPWAAWAHRITGWAYYDGNRFFSGPNPGVRAALLREGIEDYAYLWLANGGAHPAPFEAAPADVTARTVASSMTSWTRDPDALMALRHELGLYIEGSRDTLPELSSGDDGLPRGDYFLNFQDPAGPPSADPLALGGHTWMKIGWEAWDDERGWGWYGENVGTGIVMSGYADVGGLDERQRSYVYDDYGRDNLFELAIASGRYRVTAAVGRPARGYPGDPHNLRVEGVVVVDDEPTTDAEPQLVRSADVEILDGRLSLEVGGRSATTGDFAYTFLAYVTIEAID
ncbi:MAG: hypothetical protein KDK70_28645 [Myxococcales bacterium]|nr:hypothetical protein [Myxococcales bacterium]